LKNFNVVIDYERRYVWLDNFTGTVVDPPKAEPGILVFQDKGAYVVGAIYKGSPAEAAGLKVGDRLLAVDGKSLSTVRPEDVGALIKGAPESVCKLVISRGGIIQRPEIPRKVMVNRPNVE
jgi:carboxyl-terminal processing protease